MTLATLAQIANAAVVAEGRYDPKSCRQVADIRKVASLESIADYYVVLGKTFRTVTSFNWHYAVEVTKDGIACHSEAGARNAEAAAYMLMDLRRGLRDEIAGPFPIATGKPSQDWEGDR